ncbi:Sec-independent protein translocase protein TatB [Kineobactrum salinum]|uniref:Sec-independent protein translocase protein TatB n=1 Tax=Kineobactrum salinum TaxID=2708301 RepID=A0A6C0U150_9GAMM|nr:Sec-independent protein translocase protein TatB [Kineobactrum salinum]QIB65830.1 twin-arginine translocase subunit TatB [Kineobactrum salinum]
MFDIGFTELVIIGIVSLLVIGPERLPGTIRTVAAWVHRIKRGFNDVRREVEQELHNDAVLQELRKTGADAKAGARKMEQDLRKSIEYEDKTATADADTSDAALSGEPDPVSAETAAAQEPQSPATKSGQEPPPQ